MTDTFFPNTVPSEDELSLIRQIRYIPEAPQGEFFLVKVINMASGSAVEGSIKVPSWYYEHVRHFLWRHWTFMEVEHRTDLVLAQSSRAMLKRYISYMGAMIEGLLVPCRKEDGNDGAFRSSLFDLYLVVDHLVGRHEYDVGDAWRLAHPDVILECVKAETIDWQSHYRLKKESSPLWSGSQYSFDITKVPDGAWQLLADCVTSYFDSTNPETKVTQ